MDTPCGVSYMCPHCFPNVESCLIIVKYVLRDTAKNTSGKDKSTYILVPKRDDQQLSDKSAALAGASGTEVSEDESACICLCTHVVLDGNKIS
ncbi:hypothetical protein CsSME_00024949 [Camellia sinensis var. sinensis]